MEQRRPEALFAAYLREQKQVLTAEYAQEARDEAPHLRGLTLSELVDHFPEFLESFADWLERPDEPATRYVAALSEGHALQRLSLGFDLAALVAEYALMRRILLRHLLQVEGAAMALLRVDEGLDRAIYESVQRYAVARDRLRDRFLGILGHDLRSPLQSALLSARLAERGGLTDEQLAKCMERVVRGVNRVNAMIGDLLDFARTQLGGAMPVRPERTDMGEICAAAVDELRDVRPDRPVSFTSSGDLRGYWDAQRVAQALGNLVSNAVTHGLGPVTVRAWEGDDGHAVYTSVRNPGQIPPAQRAWLFDPYLRTSEDQRRGLGLGLFIVQQIALGHGATCTVDSSIDEGTTVTIRWPRVPIAEVPVR
jgi:signal transduction histidine kinase